jgi:ATP-dependent protease ClpP protease subunit
MPIPVINGNELLLYGAVGNNKNDRDNEDGWFTSSELVEALAKFRNNDVVVRINSPGGNCSDSLACYDALRSHSGNVDVVVEGVCASAGSHIAMAGRTVSIAPSAFMMIHDAACLCYGNADTHKKAAAGLDSLSDALATAYAAKARFSTTAAREMMKAETWFTADEAIAAGLADKLDSANDNPDPAPFAYETYARAPERVVALADARGWKARSIDRVGEPTPEKEPSMTGQKPTGAPPVDQRARMKAILTSEEAKGRETLAEYLAYDTDDPQEKALAILSAAPVAATEVVDPAEAYAARRVAAAAIPTASAGLSRPGTQAPGAPRQPLRWSDVTRFEEKQA